MVDNSSQEEKQNFLRENILEKGYDTNMFVEFLMDKKGEGGADVSNWSLSDLQLVVKEFISMQSNNYNYNQNTISTNDPLQKTNVIYDPLSGGNENQNNTMSHSFNERNNNLNQNNNNNQENPGNIQNINNTENINQNNNTLPQTNSQVPKDNETSQSTGDDKNVSSSNRFQPKEDVGYLYGVFFNPVEETRIVDKTPLGSVENPVIQVGFPEKVEGGFFSKSYVTYLVTTMPLNIKVRRRYSDFDWLRQIMVNLYVGNVIPSTPRKSKFGSDKFGDAFLQKRMRTLEKFLNYSLANQIIKYSQLFYDFVSIENEADFNKKKKEYEKLKPPQTIKENQSLFGKASIEVKKEKEIFFENIKDNVAFNETLLTKLNENLKLLKTQIENVTLKIDEIAQNWNELCKTSVKYYDGDDIIKTYEHMSKLFSNWSDALKRHSNVIHIDIREYFKYIKNTFRSMKDLVSIVETSKNVYYKNERYLINKKEDMFKRQDINKWELEPNDRENGNILLNDKPKALLKLCPKDTSNVISIKKTYGYYLNRIIDEYERIKAINSSLNKNNLINACDKLTEIYGDLLKGNADIIHFFNTKKS
jgi:sorting nexin-7/30/sorting nexin-8